MKSVLAILSLTLLLTGCQSVMQADVTQFMGPTPLPPGRSFVISAEPTQSGSLEFQHYAGFVGAALQDHGFPAAPPGANADLVVLVHYGSQGNHTEIWGDPWGWDAGWGWGGWRHRYAYGPYGPDMQSQTYYAEMLEVQIFDGAAWRNNVRTMLYQGRVVGDATVNDISAAFPALVTALFTHFPGNGGRIEHVAVPLPPGSGGY